MADFNDKFIAFMVGCVVGILLGPTVGVILFLMNKGII